MSAEVLVRGCSARRIKKIVELRSQGLSWEQVANASHCHAATANRWHRVYTLYGLEAFANDR